MRDRALLLARQAPEFQRKHILREYLQAHILYSLQMSGIFQNIVFQGGTALRFLYRLRRFSEDLNFALEKKEPSLMGEFSTTSAKERIEKDLKNSGFEVSIHEKKRKAIHVLSIRLPELLFELHLSRRKDENFNIHMEVDTRPPEGAATTTTVVDRYFLLSLKHHDLPSSMAGKLTAIFARPYV